MTTYFVFELYRLKRSDITLISFTKQQFQDDATMREREARQARLHLSTEEINMMKFHARKQDKLKIVSSQ